MRPTLSRIRSLMQAHRRKLAVALVILGTCAIVTGAILIDNLPVPHDPIDATFLMGSGEIAFGVFALGCVCCPTVFFLIRRYGTIKRAAILTSTTVVLASFWLIYARSSKFREASTLHSSLEQDYLLNISWIKEGKITKGCVQQEDGSLALMTAEGLAHIYQRSAAYHASLRIKYDQAARYPWLPILPDPPEPK